MWRHIPPLEHGDLIERLTRLGRPEYGLKWPEESPSLLERAGITAAHAGDLAAITLLWASDPSEFPEDDSAFAPVYAWRALGLLGATECVEPLLGMINVLDEGDDEWSPNEFSVVLGLVGEAAIDPVARFLADAGNRVMARAVAASALREVAKRRPQCGERVAAILLDHLGRYAEHDPVLNAFLVIDLAEMGTTQAVDLIDRAYAAGRIDEECAGTRGYMLEKLGMPGCEPSPEERERELRRMLASLLAPRAVEPTGQRDCPPATARRQRARKTRSRRGRG